MEGEERGGERGGEENMVNLPPLEWRSGYAPVFYVCLTHAPVMGDPVWISQRQH